MQKHNKRVISKEKAIIIVSVVVSILIIAIALSSIIITRNLVTSASTQNLDNEEQKENIENASNLENLANTETQETVNEEELQKINEEEIKKAEEEAKKSGQKINTKSKYFIRVNLQAQVINIYTYDKNGNYTVPVKAFVCSTGSGTPSSGTYTMASSGGSKRRVWTLYGGVYGQYVTPIVGDILFHSVPYLKKSGNDVVHDSLEYWEYDKLGTKASMGCIRLTTRDAKWIYDNVSLWTKVEFYKSSDPGPFGKPTAQKISNAPGNLKNWDPTDPAPNNPWRTYKPGQDDEKDNEKNEEKNNVTNETTENNTENKNSEITNNTTITNNVINNTTNETITENIENNETQNDEIENTDKQNNVVNDNTENSVTNTEKNE